jgi:bifunctional UDP-N-acetylglucosamine pyrophosphorylase/glucosamine-1-phosphate N-acetyltransferase
VLDTAGRLPLARAIVVVGHQAESVQAAHAASGAAFVRQEPQLGTGHAVLCARPWLEGASGSLLVLYGDVPLLRPATLLELMERHAAEENAVTVLTARVADPAGYGRIVRDASGRFHAIVEDKDLRPEQRALDEINSGIYTPSGFRRCSTLSPRSRTTTPRASTTSRTRSAGCAPRGCLAGSWSCPTRSRSRA